MVESSTSSGAVLFVCFLLLKCFYLQLIQLYIQQLPDLVTQLGVLYHMIESRVKMFHKLTKLHGKLYLLMTQVGIIVYRKYLQYFFLSVFFNRPDSAVLEV